jgi:hypothetical protein
MRILATAVTSIALGVLLAGNSATVRADEGCTDFKWDVGQVRALFAGPADSLAAGANLKSAPVVVPNHLYALQLLPQERVDFVSAPGKKSGNAGNYAGLAVLKIKQAGSYRVALDMPFWIDIVSNGSLVAAKDFQGQHGCSAPHKIVEFDLLGTEPFVLQLSNASPDTIRLTITPTPARKF